MWFQLDGRASGHPSVSASDEVVVSGVLHDGAVGLAVAYWGGEEGVVVWGGGPMALVAEGEGLLGGDGPGVLGPGPDNVHHLLGGVRVEREPDLLAVVQDA